MVRSDCRPVDRLDTQSMRWQADARIGREEMTLIAAFYTDTDPQDLVYHDQAECPYGEEIKRNGNDHPGTDGRRRCDWCSANR
jgi:hypothetical protein